MKWLAFALIPVCLACPAPVRAADWKPVEKVETYAVSGRTGLDLYRSIGERGPRIGAMRTIARTDFKLTWSRNYVPTNGGCTLVSARPNLTITHLVPKAAEPLPPGVDRSWETFAAGVMAHERVHGVFIKEMVARIVEVSVGLSVPGDPGCKLIRAELTRKLAALSLEQRRRSSEFDRAELGDAGNIHRLVLALANGP